MATLAFFPYLELCIIGVFIALIWLLFLLADLLDSRQIKKAMVLVVLNVLVGCPHIIFGWLYMSAVDWEFMPEIEDVQTAKEFGVYVADYRLADSLLFDSMPIKGRGFAMSNNQYTHMRAKREVEVSPAQIKYVMELEGEDKIAEILKERGLYIQHGTRFSNGIPMLRQIYVNSLLDTVYMKIYSNSSYPHWTKFDSIMFVRDGDVNLRYYDPEKNEKVVLTRSRSLKNRIKDWFFVDEVRAYLRERKEGAGEVKVIMR